MPGPGPCDLGHERTTLLMKMMFGSEPAPEDLKRWRNQGFAFSDRDEVRFGLTQAQGGPCGILAPVQAFILHHLLFQPQRQVRHEPVSAGVPLAPTDAERTAALLDALTLILQRARAPSEPRLCLVFGQSMGKLTCHRVATSTEARKLFEQSLPCLQSPLGVLLFVLSVLLTRGVDNVKSDMDDPSAALVARFGHCSQELVNLMLTGEAVSNVFDGKKEMGGIMLSGVSRRNEIGFLTLLEALRYSSKVGQNLKRPAVPIWVVGSSSHYTVLFGLDSSIGRRTAKEEAVLEAKQLFTTLDPEEEGFIPLPLAGRLAAQLGVHLPADQLERLVDPDSMGIALWQNVALLVAQRHDDMVKQAAAHAAANTPWSCGVCTFRNVASCVHCEMCASSKPRMPPAPVPPSVPAGPRDFTLYHFNGIQGIHDKAQATCRPVAVSLLEGVAGASGAGSSQGLREVVQTLWPHALVEYQGDAPKIT